VIDVGGSYHKLAHLFGGAYLEVECSERYALNPFPRKSILFKEKGTFDPDLIAFLTGLLERMVAGKIKLTPVEARILERSVIEAYVPLSEGEAPLLSDIRRVLSDYGFGDEDDRARGYQFSKELAIWTEGRFGRLLDRPGTLDLENRFLVFDLSKLTHHPELQSILFFVIRGALTRKLEDVSLKKIFVIDEGWRFFDDEAGSLLIQELYRTARKYNGLVLSISQSPEDFIRSKAATAILANSYVKYALKLQKSHDILTEFEFNENETKAVRELETRPGEYAEVFIKFFDRSVIARVEPTSLEYWIATTSPEDTVTEARERLAHPDWDELKLLRELSKKYPYGRGMKGKMWL
jgi:conjugal transfer ATP-binding protein TraC